MNPCKEHKNFKGDVCPVCLMKENEKLRDFVLWLTPCVDPSISQNQHPEYGLIGEKARELIQGGG